MRVGSVVVAMTGIAAGVVRDGLLSLQALAGPSLLAGLSVLLIYPGLHDIVVLFWRCYLAAAVSCSITLCLPLAPAVAVTINSVVVVSLLVYTIIIRFSNDKSFISNVAVWHHIEDCERLVLALLYLVLAICYVAFLDSCAPLRWTILALIAVAYLLRYGQLFLNRSLFFSKDRIAEIKRHLNGRILPATPFRTDDEMAKFSALYDRVLKLMEEKQPYLDPTLKLSDLATMLFTNKVYLSRAINAASGVNVKQFVNNYRVQYAKELMKKDPRLQVQEVAALSGFQTTASLNMAFKLFQGMTPGQYGRRITGLPSNSEDKERLL